MSDSKKYSDEYLVRSLRSPEASTRDSALRYMYREFRAMARKFVAENGGSQPEADDIFQDALIALYEQVREGKFKGESSLRLYLYAICRNLWRKRWRKASHSLNDLEGMENMPDPVQGIEKKFETDSRARLVQALLKKVGEDCRRIVTMYYYDRINMKDIMGRFGLSSEQVAKTKKYRCMQRLMALIQNDPGISRLAKEVRA